MYDILSWGRACTTTIKPLIVLMNRVIRAIYKNCSRYDAVLPFHNNLKLLQIPELYKLELLKFMFNYNNSVRYCPATLIIILILQQQSILMLLEWQLVQNTLFPVVNCKVVKCHKIS